MSGKTLPLLRDLLQESIASARERESTEFPRLAGDALPAQIILFGAGQLGRKIARILRSAGITPLAFVDNRPELAGTMCEGVPVFLPGNAARIYGGDAVFVVTIFRGEGDRGMAPRVAQLLELGCRRVTTFLSLAAWFQSADPVAEKILPHYAAALPSSLLAQRECIQKMDTLWADEISRETFRSQLLWRLRGDFSALMPPAPDQYFPRDIFQLSSGERILDGGAFDGDTLRRLGANFACAWAIEPDPKNAARLRQNADQRVQVFECALGAQQGSVKFSGSGGVDSHATADGEFEVPVDTIDTLLAAESPTFIKLDVEGSELEALRGAEKTLQRCQPVVAACLYHRPHDIWEIPLYVNSVLPNHALFLRAHENDGYELVLYAVPTDRVVD